MRRAAIVAAAAALVLGCAKKDSSATCDAPDKCAGILSIQDTGESHVELLADGEGGAYAALLGSSDSPVCVTGQVCHGQIWRLSPGGGVRWTLTESFAIDRPFLVPGGVAWRTGDGAVHAATSSGHPLWSAPVGDPKLAASWVAGAVFAAGNGSVVKIDATTGAIAWTKPFPVDNPVAPVAMPDAQVLAMGFAGAMLEAKTFALGDGAAGFDLLLPADYSAPSAFVRDPLGPIFLVSDRLTLRNWDGSEIWGLDGDEGWRFVQPLADGFAAVGPYGNRLTRVKSNGQVLWSVPSAAQVTWLSSTPDGQLLAGRNDGALDKLNVATGLLLWEYGGIAGIVASTPPLYFSNGNTVFAGANVGNDSDTHLTTVTGAGQLLERWDAGSRIGSFVLTSSDDVWLATVSGKLYLRRGASL